MFSLLLKCLLFFHPYYISVTEIDHNPTTKELEISVRMFNEDLEAVVRQNFPSQKIDLLKGQPPQILDSLISKYIRSKLSMLVDGRAVVLHYVGHEIIEESTWCYLEVPAIATVSTIHISNKLLYDYKDEQINMHVVKANGKQVTRKLDYPDTDWDFMLK